MPRRGTREERARADRGPPQRVRRPGLQALPVGRGDAAVQRNAPLQQRCHRLGAGGAEQLQHHNGASQQLLGREATHGYDVRGLGRAAPAAGFVKLGAQASQHPPASHGRAAAHSRAAVKQGAHGLWVEAGRRQQLGVEQRGGGVPARAQQLACIPRLTLADLIVSGLLIHLLCRIRKSPCIRLSGIFSRPQRLIACFLHKGKGRTTTRLMFCQLVCPEYNLSLHCDAIPETSLKWALARDLRRGTSPDHHGPTRGRHNRSSWRRDYNLKGRRHINGERGVVSRPLAPAHRVHVRAGGEADHEPPQADSRERRNHPGERLALVPTGPTPESSAPPRAPPLPRGDRSSPCSCSCGAGGGGGDAGGAPGHPATGPRYWMDWSA